MVDSVRRMVGGTAQSQAGVTVSGRRLPLAAVLRALLDWCPPVAEERRSPFHALGFFAADTVRALAALPAQSLSLVDGWAVCAADTVAASPYTPIAVGETERLTIGQAVPRGRDAVVPGEAVVFEQGHPMVQSPLAAGQNLRRAGEDLPADGVLLAKGYRVNPWGAALATRAGLTSITVRVPRLLILYAPGGESAALCLAAEVGRSGAESQCLPLDDAAAAKVPVHLTVVIGGPAIGANDPALAWAAVQKGWRMIGCPALRPGDTILCGLADRGPILIVPERLDALFCAFLVIVSPLLAALAGAETPVRRETRRLVRKVVSTVGVTELALLADAGDGQSWEPIGVGSFDWTAVVSATAYAVIPPESEGAADGTLFEATILNEPQAIWSKP